MSEYIYKAKGEEGDKEGTIIAENEVEAARILKDKGLIPVVLKRQKEKKKRSLSLFSRISVTDKLMFTRNLMVMTKADLPLPRSLQVISGQMENKKFRKVLGDIEKELVKGESFSESLSNHPDVFSSLFVNMIEVGEASGGLSDVLEVLSKQMHRKHELRSEIIGALIYPAVIILAMIAIGVGMLVFVVPKISETFVEIGIDLPPTTQFVINLGNLFRDQWHLFVGGLGLLVFLFLRFKKEERFKESMGWMGMRLPIVSELVEKINAAQTLRALSSLLSVGVSLPSALEITAGVSKNIFYKRELLDSIERVTKGERLSTTLEGKEIYPSLVTQMISVGEETGETSSILDNLADFYEDKVTRFSQNLTSILEPVIMFIVGAAIGFFAISMIQPMYSMIGAMQ